MEIEQIINRYEPKEENVLAVLQDIQKRYNYLSEDILLKISSAFNVPLSRVYSLATFYKVFSLKPKGKNIIYVCLGTACHVRGGPKIVETIERFLGIKAGETTKDGNFTLETVNCLGACALGPLVVINENYHGKMTQSKIQSVIENINEQNNKLR